MCFGNGGTWRPFRLNECMKFGKYQQREHFGTHIDGPWVPRADESSIYTVLVYLNDDFTGGRTVFLPEAQREEVDAGIAAARTIPDRAERSAMERADALLPQPTIDASALGFHSSSDGHVTVFPRSGSALVFTHDTVHAGLPVLSGCKYVLRTEIMFQRVDSSSIPQSVRESFTESPEYQRTLTLYLDSYAKGETGDVVRFTNSYLAALELQHQAQLSVGADTKAIHSLNLPLALYVHVFTFLSVGELSRALQCNRAFRDIAADGTLWKQHYQIRFPHQHQMEAKMQQQQRKKVQQEAADASLVSSMPEAPIFHDFGAIDPAVQDWHTIYRQRLELERDFSAVIFDLGSYSTKCTMLTALKPPLAVEATAPVLEMRSVVARVPGLYDIHIRRHQWDRSLVGKMAIADQPQYARHVLVGGNLEESIDVALLTELVAGNLLRLGVWSHQHPLLIAEPPFGWRETRRTLTNFLVRTFRVPAVCFVNSGLLSLLSQQLDSGIVAHFGEETAWVAGFHQRRMIAFQDLTPGLASGNQKRNNKDAKTIEDWEVHMGVVPIVAPDHLAQVCAELYNRMLAQVKDEDATLHHVVLCGGRTIDSVFRRGFAEEVTKINNLRRHTSATTTTADFRPDLEIILPARPTHTVVEGGRIFAGLSIFREYCIRSFDTRFAMSPHYALASYIDSWSADDWLHGQLLVRTIAHHFHREDDEWIANTSCSDGEVERILDLEAEGRARRLLKGEQPERTLVWRRRRADAKKRREAEADTGSSSSTSSSSLSQEPYPSRRNRRSAFAVLPSEVASWFDRQQAQKQVPLDDDTAEQPVLATHLRALRIKVLLNNRQLTAQLLIADQVRQLRRSTPFQPWRHEDDETETASSQGKADPDSGWKLTFQAGQPSFHPPLDAPYSDEETEAHDAPEQFVEEPLASLSAKLITQRALRVALRSAHLTATTFLSAQEQFAYVQVGGEVAVQSVEQWFVETKLHRYQYDRGVKQLDLRFCTIATPTQVIPVVLLVSNHVVVLGPLLAGGLWAKDTWKHAISSLDRFGQTTTFLVEVSPYLCARLRSTHDECVAAAAKATAALPNAQPIWGPEPLPPSPWRAALDPKTHRPFYTNEVTSEVVWEAPIEAELPCSWLAPGVQSPNRVQGDLPG